MTTQYSSQEWYSLAKNLYELIISDIENITDDSLPEVYPTVVIMYEFFRLVRGEAFYDSRPGGMAEFQDSIYKMENDIGRHLDELKSKLDPSDSKTKYYLDLMKKSFNL